MIFAADRCQSRAPSIYVADSATEVAEILNPKLGDVAMVVTAGGFAVYRLTDSTSTPDGTTVLESNACQYVWIFAGPDLDVALCGAILDGVTDDGPAIQACIDALPASGGNLVITGVAAIGAGGLLINGKTNVSLIGQGWSTGFVSLAQTTLDIPTSASTGTIIALNNCTGCVIRNLSVDGAGFKNKGIGMEGCTNCTIADVEIFDTDASGGAANTRNLAGIMSFGGTRNSYLNNTVHDTTGECRGLWIGNTNPGEPELNPLIDGNHVYSTGHTGIGGTMDGARIVNNNCEDCNSNDPTAGAGIKFGSFTSAESSRRSLIANNIIRRCSAGIQGDASMTLGVDAAMGCIVSNNVCEENYFVGIWVIYVTDWIVTGNICRNNRTSGIGSIHGGIFMDHADRCIVSLNNCREDRAGAARTQSSGITINANGGNCSNINIVGNICDNNLEYGIVVVSVNKTVTNLVVTANTITNNSIRGLSIAETNPGEITSLILGPNLYQGNTLNVSIGATINAMVMDPDLGYTGNNVDATGRASYHPGGVYAPTTSANSYLLSAATHFGDVIAANTNTWGLQDAAYGWYNTTGGFSFGKSTAPISAQVESQWTGGAQLSLSYDNTNFARFTVASDGDLMVSPVGYFGISLARVPVYANQAAAVGGGLTAGQVYRTGADPDVLCIVN